jgi:hypothetical protein
MVESSSSPAIVKERNPKNIFSSYIEIQDILIHSFKPLIHIVGFQKTHQQILQITLDNSIVKESKNYKQYNVQSYEFYEGAAGQNAPAIYTQTSKGDRLKQNSSANGELGFLKYSFFKGITLFKPAVSILVFDW